MLNGELENRCDDSRKEREGGGSEGDARKAPTAQAGRIRLLQRLGSNFVKPSALEVGRMGHSARYSFENPTALESGTTNSGCQGLRRESQALGSGTQGCERENLFLFYEERERLQ